MLVAVSNVVETDSMTYLKAQKLRYKKKYYKLNNSSLDLKYNINFSLYSVLLLKTTMVLWYFLRETT